MKKKLRWKAVLIAFVIVLSVWAFYPLEEKIKLGLDLKGGIHLILKVHTIDALNAVTNETSESLARLLDDDSIAFEDITKQEPGQLLVSGLEISKESAFNTTVQNSLPAWDSRKLDSGRWELRLRDSDRAVLRDETVSQAIETIRNRVDDLGVAEPIIAPHGARGDQILVQLPGYKDVAQAKRIIKSTAKLELKLVTAGPGLSENQLLGGSAQPSNTEIVSGNADPGGVDKVYYLVESVPAVTGRDLKNARRALDYDTNTPNVSFTLKPDAASRFQRITRDNIGTQLAIILDGKVQSAPFIEGAIYDQGQITGNFTLEEAQDLALVLRSGALPASLEYQEERTVGPSLGADSIRSGVTASILGLAAVVLFILFYYRLSGMNAVIALTLNLSILFGTLAYLAATLTLPGIAGVILIIGMGVDANVLIFEGIKEEMRGGKMPRTAISAGFGKVLWTIFDANVTSLVAAAILFQFGTGPIQGFAVTLSIGLFSNMFTAIFVSRFIFDFILGGRRQVEALSI